MRIVVGWVKRNGTHRMLINSGFRFSSPTLQFRYIIFWEIPKSWVSFLNPAYKLRP